MDLDQSADAFAALGHSTRLAVVRLLARRTPGSVPAGELADAVGASPSTLTRHLDQLVQAGLVERGRDGRQMRYRLSIRGTGRLVRYLLADCCRGRPDICGADPGPRADGPREDAEPAGGRVHVLFLCTGNSARSIMAEAVLATLGGPRFVARSAGVRPKPQVHPLTLRTLEEAGYETEGLYPKTPEDLIDEGAGRFDYVFTLCDHAANQECPIWPGQPMGAHWGLPDPAAARGTEADRVRAFRETLMALEGRIGTLVHLPIAALDRLTLQRRLDEIGLGAGAAETAEG